MKPIYLDNAATSWPKPKEVLSAMTRFMEESAGNPGRSGHRLSVEAGRLVASTRETVCEFFGFTDPLRVVFGSNATWALNLAINGLLKPGDRIVTGSMEHNSVMRPLRALQDRGVELVIVQCSKDGTLDLGLVEQTLSTKTKLLVFNHASNVVGTILPISDLGRLARDNGALLLVDAASAAGAIPVHMEKEHIDLLAFTGHKFLLGPTGTGGLLIGDRVDVDGFEPLVRGGTGSRSEYDIQPKILPDAFESGTLNAVGLAGLKAGIEWIAKKGIQSIRSHKMELTQYLLDGLGQIEGVNIFGTKDPELQTGIVSFTLDGISVSEGGTFLDEVHGVLCRVGLHCAPNAHRTIGTFPGGTIRFALSVFTGKKQLDRAIEAVKDLLRK